MSAPLKFALADTKLLLEPDGIGASLHIQMCEGPASIQIWLNADDIAELKTWLCNEFPPTTAVS